MMFIQNFFIIHIIITINLIMYDETEGFNTSATLMSNIGSKVFAAISSG